MPPRGANLYDHDDASDVAADSGHLRISHNTAYESGIPPAHERAARESDPLQKCLAHLELALVESMRAESNVGLLLRGLGQLATSANTAREANAALLAELAALRTTLTERQEYESALEQRALVADQALDSLKGEIEREHQLWIEQEDAFLVELMTDYEEKLCEALAQRDAARAEVRQIAYERDTALKLLSEPAGDPDSPANATPFELGYMKLRKTPLKQKPEASTRPLIGYSVRGEGVSEERVESSRSSTPSPKK